jgi:putative membrane protein
MKRIFFISVFSLATVFMISCDKDEDDNNNNNNNTPNATDNNFMTQAAYGNYNEIALGQLALTKATNDSVKMFAQMMITDHTAANASLDSLADRYTYSLPTGADSAHLAFKDSLDTYTGHTFDTAYINSQVRDHQTTIDLFQNEISSGNADSVQNFATRLLPKIQAHKALADSIATNLQ